MPPATKTSNRGFASEDAPGRAARCQLGFALRREVAPVDGVDLRLGAATRDGCSLTYGNNVGSSLLPTWS